MMPTTNASRAWRIFQTLRSRARALERRNVVTRYYRFGIAAAAIAAVLIGAACRPSGPRVFFVQPQEGATVKLEFGVQDFTIAAVPQGTVAETRPSLGHYHIGVDADCLPPGTVIPRASPWVHFGDGKNVIDMQLPAGMHKLTLQV